MILAKQYSGVERQLFDVVATYCPNEENDTWIKYRNATTLQEYTCRLEAFLARFHPCPD